MTHGLCVLWLIWHKGLAAPVDVGLSTAALPLAGILIGMAGAGLANAAVATGVAALWAAALALRARARRIVSIV